MLTEDAFARLRKGVLFYGEEREAGKVAALQFRELTFIIRIILFSDMLFENGRW